MTLLLSVLVTVAIYTSALAQAPLTITEPTMQGTQIAQVVKPSPPPDASAAASQEPQETQILKRSNEQGPQKMAPPSAAPKSGPASWWTPELVWRLSISVLVFTGAALVLCTVLLWGMKPSPQLVLKLFGLLTIIGMSAWLVVVGYSSEQLTPVVGLFGAIAGYLLGKDTKPDSPKAHDI